MRVFQIRVKLYILKNFSFKDVLEKTAHFIDSVLVQEQEWKNFHEKNQFKNYCFDMPWPVEKDQQYHEGKIYTLTIRTIDNRLADFFNSNLCNAYTEDMKGLVAEIKEIPKYLLEKIYSLTPVILKTDTGYWRSKLSVAEYSEQLKTNLIKKYNGFTGEKLNEDFELFTLIEFSNPYPIPCKYKEITLLGDKLTLHVATNQTAQEIAYMALGTAIGCCGARGYGMLNYQWYGRR